MDTPDSWSPSSAAHNFSVSLTKGSPQSNPSVYVGETGAIGKYLEHSAAGRTETFAGSLVPAGDTISIILQVGSGDKGASAYFGHLFLDRRDPAKHAEPPKTSEAGERCAGETIFIKSYQDCWDDPLEIVKSLMIDMQAFATSKGVQLFAIGIPANETFWGDESLQQIGASRGPSVPPPEYDRFLALMFGVTIDDIDLSAPDRSFEQVMAAADVPHLDLKDVFLEAARTSHQSPYCRWFSGHLCEYGHRLVAHAMATSFSKLVESENATSGPARPHRCRSEMMCHPHARPASTAHGTRVHLRQQDRVDRTRRAEKALGPELAPNPLTS